MNMNFPKDYDDHQMRMAAARLLVGNINQKITKGDMEGKFAKYGKLLDVEMHKTFSYLQFEREEDAIQAMKNENGTLFKGARLEITHELDLDRNGQQRPGFGRSRRSPPPARIGPGFPRDRSPLRETYDPNFRDSFKKDDRFGPRPDAGFPDDFRRFPAKRFEEEAFKHRLDPKEDLLRSRAFIPGPGDVPLAEVLAPPCNNCEIIVLNKMHRNYAESVERRLKGLGLTVDLMFLFDELALVRTIRDIARRGTLYAVIIGRQHEMHLSVTLNILYDNPQEHRNMPLEDALKLIARNFQEHVQKKREKLALDKGPDPALPPVEREIQLILNTLADGKYVTLSELEKVIQHLQDRRDRMKAAEAPKKTEKEEVSTAEQQDLQQRILSIINQSGGDAPPSMVQAPVPAPLPVPPPPAMQQQASPSPFLNFDNPNLQKALDSLIQSGPNLLKSISFAGTMPPPAANNQAQAMQNNMMNRPNSNMFGGGNLLGQNTGGQQGPMRHPLLGTQVGGGGSNAFFGPRGPR